MTTSNKVLAKIRNAVVEIEDHSILTCWVTVDYEDGGTQGIGGYELDSYDKAQKKRVGTAYGCEVIRRHLEVFGVHNFDALKGRMVWVTGEGSGFSFRPYRFESLNTEAGSGYLDYRELAEEYADESGRE